MRSIIKQYSASVAIGLSVWLAASPLSAASVMKEADVTIAKPALKFLPLPPRGKHGVAAMAQKQTSYSLSKVQVQKKHTAIQQKIVDKIPQPTDGDAHKLLLYVYDEMR